jgi:hypothetical protein
MTRSPQTLERILATDPVTAAWMDRQRRQAALTLHIRRHLPRALASRIRVADDQGPELLLGADVGAIAGIARQRAPDLLLDLRRAGYEFTSIRVRVQVKVDSRQIEKSPSKQIDKKALQSIGIFARGLPPGSLKASLARFLRRVG